MNAFQQIQEMKQDLYNDLSVVLENYRVDIGRGLLNSDVVGVIEQLKFDYQQEMLTGDQDE